MPLIEQDSSDKYLLISCPTQSQTASSILSLHPSSFHEITVRWNVFPDGFPDIFIEKSHELRDKNVVFLADFFNPSYIFPQLACLYQLPRYCIKGLIVVLPWFATGTFERVMNEGEVPTASTLTRLLSNIPPSQSGPTRIIHWDIHQLSERFFYGDFAIPLLATAIPLYRRILEERFKHEEISIVFPDDGAAKRFESKFENKYHIIICSKVRLGDSRMIKIKDGNPKGKHCFIIDDLVQSGGTLMECAKACLELNATNVSAFVTHAVFPKQSWKKFQNSIFKHFFITDSCPDMARELNGKKPFEIIPLAQDIASVIL